MRSHHRRRSPPLFFLTPTRMTLPPQGLRNISSGVPQGRVNVTEEFLVAKRLGEVTNRPGIERLGSRIVVCESRDEDNWDHIASGGVALLKFDPGHALNY